jgi:hypothetical protein
MMHFFRVRGLSLAIVVLVMVLIAGLQAGISYSVALGPLRQLESTTVRILLVGFYGVRIALLLVLATVWALNRKHLMFRIIIAANAYFTLVLLYECICPASV